MVEYSAPDKLCSQEKIFNQSLSDLEEGKYPAPAGSSLTHGGREIPAFSPFYEVIFSHIKGERGLKSTGKVVPGGTGSLKDPFVGLYNHSSPPTPHPHMTNGLYTAVPFT